MHLFRPAGRLTFASRGKSKQKRLPHHPALRCAPGSLAPVPLRRHAPMGHPWPIGAFSASCLETCYATPPLGLLKGRLGAHRIICVARTDSPVRRVSGIGVQGVERHGCRERRKGPGTALVRRPLEQRWSERTRNVAKRSAGPYVGGPSFAYFSWANKKSEAPCKAQPVASLVQGKRCVHSAIYPLTHR